MTTPQPPTKHTVTGSLFEIGKELLCLSDEDALRMLTPLLLIRLRDIKRQHKVEVQEAYVNGFKAASGAVVEDAPRRDEEGDTDGT